MKQNIYSNTAFGDTNIALKAVEKSLIKFQKKLPTNLQQTFNRVHDAVIKLLLKSYFGNLIDNDPKIQRDLTIIIITALYNVKQKTTSERTLNKLNAIHRIALDQLEYELHIAKYLRPATQSFN